MTSQVDVSIPVDNEKVSKEEIRNNFSTIRDEITALQRKTREPWRMVFGTRENEV